MCGRVVQQRDLHDRMPVIIASADRDRWLTNDNPVDLLKPYPAELMTMWPMSRDVNSPKNDRSDLLDRVDDPEPWGASNDDVRVERWGNVEVIGFKGRNRAAITDP